MLIQSRSNYHAQADAITLSMTHGTQSHIPLLYLFQPIAQDAHSSPHAPRPWGSSFIPSGLTAALQVWVLLTQPGVHSDLRLRRVRTRTRFGYVVPRGREGGVGSPRFVQCVVTGDTASRLPPSLTTPLRTSRALRMEKNAEANKKYHGTLHNVIADVKTQGQVRWAGRRPLPQLLFRNANRTLLPPYSLCNSETVVFASPLSRALR